MLRVKLEAPGKLVYEDVPVPEPKEGEALIAVKSVGICYSDVLPYSGRNLSEFGFPMVQGHEFGGVIEKINGDGGEFKTGMKVAVYPMTECGQCYYCKHGMDLMCENQTMFGSFKKEGGMAEKVAVPLSQLVILKDGFDIRYAGLFEPATVAYRSVGEFKDSNVLILGTGAIGMMMVQICKGNNNKVIAMDISDDILQTAKDLGADYTVNVKEEGKVDLIKNYLGSEKVDAVVITYLSQENLDFALEIVRKHGTIINMASPQKLTLDFTPMLFKAINLQGKISYNFDMFKKAAELVQNGTISYKKLVSRMFPLNETKEAYEYKLKNPVLKVILTD